MSRRPGGSVKAEGLGDGGWANHRQAALDDATRIAVACYERLNCSRYQVSPTRWSDVAVQESPAATAGGLRPDQASWYAIPSAAMKICEENKTIDISSEAEASTL
jgi:hypothetical protein